jgi:hypothetical protein
MMYLAIFLSLYMKFFKRQMFHNTLFRVFSKSSFILINSIDAT